ncbi:aromatic-ring-hydroxylating dioxygenase subunit beta [Bordetella sp. FB-8]|uniref:aromatic-ring-hydroxylating dioxygenase subunit beta n=1 Tax=Bordetella sp. FB-8 TaxID=1159870 RepID=UPI000366BCE7|nr:aromatic-ring-hydroxylating dioxygenase subunit beta [Bordetella sp. FB-8]
MMQAPADADLTRLIYQEARLIDQGRFDEWYALYAEDGLYWMPLAPGQHSGLDEPALMYEDKMLLRLRLDRMKDPRAHSLHPAVRCLHVLQAPEVTGRDAAAAHYTLSTPFIYVETQGDTQHILAATAEHELIGTPQGLRIKTKKVLLLNCDAALPAIQLLP